MHTKADVPAAFVRTQPVQLRKPLGCISEAEKTAGMHSRYICDDILIVDVILSPITQAENADSYFFRFFRALGSMGW